MESNGILAAVLINCALLMAICWALGKLKRNYDSLAKECEQMHRLCRELILRTEPTKKIRAGVKVVGPTGSKIEGNTTEQPVERPASMASLRAMAESSMTEEQARARRVERFNG